MYSNCEHNWASQERRVVEGNIKLDICHQLKVGSLARRVDPVRDIARRARSSLNVGCWSLLGFLQLLFQEEEEEDKNENTGSG